MKKLSIITAARDDNFAGDFIERLKKSITYNIKFMEKNNIDFEYIIVDWFPLNKQYLYKNKDIEELLSDSRIHNVIVDNSIAEPEKLNSLVLYEWFAKNAGIRLAKGDYILLTNGDIIMSQQLWEDIKEVLERPEIDNDHYFRSWERLLVNFEDDNTLNVKQSYGLHYPDCPNDSHICSPYSGDFTFVSKQAIIEKGRAHNEEDPDHRHQTYWQAGMDGEILWNMYNHGMRLHIFKNPYYHIEHGNSCPQLPDGKKRLDGVYKAGIKYENKSDWGFINYPSKKENNVTTIFAS